MIYIHIGKSKTGTTTIQLGLNNNKELLGEMGYLYPKNCLVSDGHHNIYFEYEEDERFSKEYGTVKQLIEEIKVYKKQNPSGNIILSSETIETLASLEYWDPWAPGKFDSFITTLSELDEVTVIVLLRRQDKYYQSFWSMHVTEFSITDSLEEYVDNMVSSELRIEEDYNLLIENLEKVKSISHIQVKSFEQLIENNIFLEFLRTCGLNEENIGKIVMPVNANTAPSPLAIELMRTLHLKLGEEMTREAKKDLEPCIRQLGKMKEWKELYGEKKLLSKSDYQEIKEKFQAGNLKLQEKFGNLESLIFDDDYEPSPAPDFELIPIEDLLELSLSLLSRALQRKHKLLPSHVM